MEVRLSGDDVEALVQQVLDLGFERLENYSEQCQNLDYGTGMCLADASHTVLRVRLPSGEPRQVRIYANFGSDLQALESIRSTLREYSHPDARPYVPAKATLFIRSTILRAWLEADDKGRQRARVVDGDALATLLAKCSRTRARPTISFRGCRWSKMRLTTDRPPG